MLGALALLAGSVVAASPASGATTGSISGTVTSSAAGSPIAGVCVDAFSLTSSDFFTDDTAADGTYQLTGVTDGDYLVEFNKCGPDAVDGYAGEYYQDTRDVVQAATVTVAGATRTGIDATLDAAGIVAGSVTDDGDGTPLTGICVVALGDNGSDFGVAETDGSGGYRIGSMAPGTYVVAALDCGAPFTYESELYDDVSFANPQAQPTDVTTTGGQTATADFALAEGGELSGTILASHLGRGVAQRCVQLISDADPAVELDTVSGVSVDATPLPDGDYVIGGIPAGSYHAVVNGPGCGDDTFSTAAPATPIVIAPGDTASLDATLVPEPGLGLLCPDGSTASSFPDVPESSTHHQAIECLLGGGIANGRADGTFGPGEAVTRAQMAAFVARGLDAVGLVLPDAPADAFDDDNGNFAERQINQLAELGIVNGRAPRTYDPGAPVTRGQMAKFIVGAYQAATGVDILPGGDHFTDDDGTAFEGFIDRLANAAITTGTASGTYEPGTPVHRDQMASCIARALNRGVADDPFGTRASPAAAARAAAAPGTADPRSFLRSPRTWIPARAGSGPAR
jgi:hypothetical protein